MMYDRLAHHCAQLGHTVGKPRRNLAIMEWQVCTAGSLGHRCFGSAGMCSARSNDYNSPDGFAPAVTLETLTASGFSNTLRSPLVPKITASTILLSAMPLAW